MRVSFFRPNCLVFALCLFCFILSNRTYAQSPLDDTGGFISLSPGVVHTNNGCSEFNVSVHATLTDARVFGLVFAFDQANLELLAVTPGPDTTLHLLPYTLAADTLRLDGFFHPNFPAGTVTLATLRCRAIAPNDVNTLIGFISGQGYGHTADNPEAIIFTGDTSTVMIDGTAPRAPEGLIIVTPPFPAHDDSVRLQWLAVTEDLNGQPVVNPLYTVYLHDLLNNLDFTLGTTTDTFFWDGYIYNTRLETPVVNIGLYEVRACKPAP